MTASPCIQFANRGENSPYGERHRLCGAAPAFVQQARPPEKGTAETVLGTGLGRQLCWRLTSFSQDLQTDLRTTLDTVGFQATKNRSIPKDTPMVRVAGVEPTASWTRTMRATNCATPGNSLFIIREILSDVKISGRKTLPRK